MSSSPVILLVGATGFLGKKIVASFLKQQKETQFVLKAMSRRAQSSANGVNWVVGDLMKPDTLDDALAGVDIVLSSANGYMKESLDADIQGNKNLIEAAAKAKVKRFVLLSIVTSDKASYVPHFNAKYLAEELLKKNAVPFVSVRAPAFLDQEQDVIASNAKAGRLLALGDADKTAWSYICTADLAEDLVKAALHPKDDILNQIIDVGWEDGALTQRQVAKIIDKVTERKSPLWVYTLPWFVVLGIGNIFGRFSPLVYDMTTMFRFMRTGVYVSDLAQYHKFFGKSVTAEDAIRRWAQEKGLMPSK